jgi:hypothetical protein
MQKWCLLTLLFIATGLVGCGQPDVDLTYPTGADDLIVQASSTGGLVPLAYVDSYIPEFRLYGDGRAVWTEWKDGRTSVSEGHLSTEEVAELLAWIADRRFFGLDDFYTVKDAPLDLPNDCVRVNLANEQKTVCEYYDGAPKAFWEVYSHLRSGADVADYRPYQPQMGWVYAEPITWGTPESVPWSESLVPAPSTIGDGVWVDGETLDYLWQGRLEQGPWMVYEENGDLYGLVLQVPGLMPNAPDAP